MTLDLPKWHALVAGVVIDTEAGDVDVVVVVVVVVEVGFDVVEDEERALAASSRADSVVSANANNQPLGNRRW